MGGAQRTVIWDDLNPTQRLSVHDRGVDKVAANALDPDTRGRTIVSYRTGETIAPALPNLEALRSVMLEFAAAIAEGRAPLTDGRAGLRVLAVLEAASMSLANDGVPVPIQSVDGPPLAVVEEPIEPALRGRGEVTV